ncbi:unnamed protein product [Moneuplotes crassus]|uniref:Ribosomal protein L46 N-terminal domain-containing protein n=1 Tax=Euplotes crassus TaxID=5936 RepID=A0AAD1XGQ7_EUPCR|nr:unnamed protein product [Moneuplotes crassus]
MWLTRRHSILKRSFPVRSFSLLNLSYYDGSERQREYTLAYLERMMKTMENMQEERFFDYERRKAKYDPKTGKIELLRFTLKPEKKIIKNFDDMQREKAELSKELKLSAKDVESASEDELAKRYEQLYERTEEGYLINRADFYAESIDKMRIDCGLIVQRPPIFLYQHKFDRDWLVFKNKITNEYDFDLKKYYKEIKEDASLMDSMFANNPYISLNNIDNLPSHEQKMPDGTVKRYCASSKHWKKVDPAVTDNKSLHYCAQQKIYLLLRNKYTGKWEFPSTAVFGTESFMEARKEFFATLSDNKWFVSHKNSMPIVSTLRPFTEHEKKDEKNVYLHGVRTYYFNAYHLRGLTDMCLEDTDWDDFVWASKADMNKYLCSRRFGIFNDILEHR